jgi:copper(I)-binding protein
LLFKGLFKLRKILVLIILFLQSYLLYSCCAACDQDSAISMTKDKNIQIDNAYFSILKGAVNGAAYCSIKSLNLTADDQLLKAEYLGKGITNIELHTHIIENGVARMREVEAFTIDKKLGKILEPGHDHIMLINISPDFCPSELMLVLTFKNAGKVTVKFKKKETQKSCCQSQEKK